MRPRVLKVDPLRVDPEILRQASEVIHNRGLVAFPTETVYGLGANALDVKAVSGIFEAKKRPLDDPLIVHIERREDLYALAKEVPPEAEKLADRFWPGPLTLVLKKSDKVPDLVTTGLDTVALRMPSNAVAKKLIETAGVPIAAPSANLFGRPSPTTARHVIDDLDGRIDMVLDGGSTDIGIESTVVEFIEGRTIVLRPGGTDVEKLRLVVGRVEVAGEAERIKSSPGTYPQHYSPEADIVLVADGPSQVNETIEVASDLASRGRKVGIMAREEHAGSFDGFDVKVLGPGADGKVCASRLFHILREFDADEVGVIVAEGIPEKGLGLAVMNRLRKASGPDTV